MSPTKLNQKHNQSKLSTDMMRAYLHEIGQIPLLDHAEEIIYGKQVLILTDFVVCEHLHCWLIEN